MSETMAPEDVRELMNRCFDGMVDAVKRYDGHVDKFIGDCIMVVFGAPKSHEDDPERAVRCALDMQAWLTEVNKTVARPLGVRIGINAGEVVAGGVGGKDTKDYTVMGDVVNTANRNRIRGKHRKNLGVAQRETTHQTGDQLSRASADPGQRQKRSFGGL